MADLGLDCPSCGAANTVPMDVDSEVFTCSSCGEEARIEDAATHVTEDVPDYLVGEVISDCRVVAKVGEGGFGSVYKAIDQNLQRPVALKVMLQSLSSNLEFVQKFIREAVTAAQLNHPNIVAIHSVGRDERRGLHYLIMEFVEGETLNERVERQGVYSVDDLVPVALQACDALATAHEAHIVHRDIKPDNLMLDAAGVVKITDFGLAKSLASEQHTTKVMGTPHYMSPEQFEGKAVDGRSDIYSLGVTFYYLLSKARPYEGQNTVQIIYSILTQEPKPLTDVAGESARPVWTVIERMIEKKAEDRYQSLRETIDDLRRLQQRAAPDRSECPECGSKNPKTRKFCRGCGAALLVKCPACGNPEPARAPSCGSCGADMARLLQVRKALQQGKRFRALGDLRRAEEFFRQAVELDGGNVEAATELSGVTETLGELERVLGETDELVRTGDMDGALSRVETLLLDHPTSVEIREQRDRLRRQVAAHRVNALMEEAETAASDGDVRLALERLDAALRVDAERADVRARRDELGRRVAQVTESRQKAVEALAAGRFEDAFSLASEVLQVTPGDAAMEDVRARAQASVASVEGMVAQGHEKLGSNDWSEALSRFETALALRPGDEALLALVGETRGRIRSHRERLGVSRRRIADGEHDAAIADLEALLAQLPGDVEARSLLAAANTAAEESRRAGDVTRQIAEARRLREAGDLGGCVAALQAALELDPRQDDARTTLREVESLARNEHDVRDLADEYLQNGRYDEAVETLERLRVINPARGAALDAEIAATRDTEKRVRTSLRRAGESLTAREFRRAAEAAARVLEMAPRHPRATAIQKDADKAVAAIDRFLRDADRLILSEMFDEAVEILDKARERGATGEEYTERRAACEQGRLALLKTDATRSLVARDYEAAIAAYEQVLEVAGEDTDALRGKRAAQRRMRILTTEPLAMRLGAAAVVLLLLGLVRTHAVASTATAATEAQAVANVEREAAREVVVVETGQLEPRLDDAADAEAGGDLRTALAVYEREMAVEGGKFAARPELTAGREFARAVLAASELSDPRERLDALGEAETHVGFSSGVRERRRAILDAESRAAVAAWFAEVGRLEADDPRGAIATIGEIEKHPVARLSPALAEVKGRGDFLEALTVGDDLLGQSPPAFADAAASFRYAADEMRDDAARRGVAEGRLAELRGQWMTRLREMASDASDDAEAFEAISGLEEFGRTLGIPRERVLDEFRR